MRSPAYNIGDRVFYTLPGSSPGIIIDIIFRLSTQKYEYQVSTLEDVNWVHDFEISEEVTIV